MPSFEEHNDVPDTPTSQMTRSQVEAEIVKVSAHLKRLEIANEDPVRYNLTPGSPAQLIMTQTIVDRRHRIEALEKRMQTLNEWDRAVFGQNMDQGSMSRNRSSQSPPGPSGPRAPNNSPQR
ncbi:hypothetical protein EAF00_006218 [Botryotinia globosa]|nr:hypothetical protein EAF00_006218 [Botryotinia globosa]